MLSRPYLIFSSSILGYSTSSELEALCLRANLAHLEQLAQIKNGFSSTSGQNFFLSHGGHIGYHISRSCINQHLYQITNFFLDNSYQVSGHIHLSVQKKLKAFQDGRHGSHLGFMLWTIFTILDLVVTKHFLLSFNLISFWVQEEKFKMDFQDKPVLIYKFRHSKQIFRSEWF